jgi:ATPase subunit of ABC transporter with duplicated ATPase domains
MDELPLRLKTFLLEAADEMRRAGLPPSLSSELERLSGQVDQPCVVAVVGRMKAGKSTFINALLGEDLAKVGVTETTATINYFRYGNANPAKPGRDENTCRQRRPREEWIGIPVPALIDQETYRRAQEQLERNATLSFRNKE